MSGMSRDTQKTFTKDIPKSIKEGLDPKKYETAGQKISKFFGGIFDGIKKGFSSAWDWLTGKGPKNNPKPTGFAKGGIVYNNIPKLASGGIINTPGRGVPIVSAIGGERGKEGVIPLTDSQQMALLGEAIGKYITLNANIPVYVGNRQIAKEIRKINAENDFAYNR